MVKKFKQRSWDRYSRLGKRRKKKQVWRRPTGRHNKMREKRKGKPAVVGIGFKKSQDKGERVIMISNIQDLKNVKSKGIFLIGKVGKKKRIEISREAEKMKIKIRNMNSRKILRKEMKKEEKSKEIKKWIWERRKN